MTEPQGLSDAARDIMMRGGVPGNATQWVARVAKGLEAHYRTLQRRRRNGRRRTLPPSRRRDPPRSRPRSAGATAKSIEYEV